MTDVRLETGDCREVMSAYEESTFTACVTDPPYELGFMGKDWDQAGVSYDSETWRAVLRVLKPGAFLLAFGGTRTYHRMTCAIEDAGFEVRDCMMWLYGNGFPKSHNISKAISKSGDRTASDMWDGYGTALKPAWEPVVVAMKSLSGTFAKNALEQRVAGLNVDGGRVEYETGGSLASNPSLRRSVKGGNGGHIIATESESREMVSHAKGRWPANLLLDEESGAMLDKQSGERPGCRSRSNAKPESKFRPGQGEYMPQGPIYPDTGGASRFFYCAKSSKKERGEGNDHPTVKPLRLMKHLLTLVTYPEQNLVLDPFCGSGTTLLACREMGLSCVGIDSDPHAVEIAEARGVN